MMRINYEASDYERIEDIKTLVDSVSSLFDDFYNSFNNRYESLQKVDRDIESKKKEIETYESTIRDCDLKIDELSRLRDKTKGDIEELSLKKKDISYTDSEVQRMEEEDIDTEISNKTEKIAKIETKLLNTQEKREINKFNKEDAEKALEDITREKKQQELFVKKTEKLLDLVTNTKERFKEDIATILENDDDSSDEALLEQNDIVEEVVKEEDTDYPKIDFDLKEINLDFDAQDNEDNQEEIPDTETDSTIDKAEAPVSIDEDELNIEIDDESSNEADITVDNVDSPLKKIFEENGITYEDIPSDAREKLEQNIERVKANIEVLKKHQIPLELTINQNKIYYKKDANDLDELLKIITTDEEGNGMGFTIDFVYYILDELSEVDTDSLINVYNSEFMKVDAKSGLIELLKKTGKDLGSFENNKQANRNVLTDLGVTTVAAIETAYPEFMELDNPLLLNALNLFDKDDLVEKLNGEIKIIPKILAYWRNN